tara:strand:+ start:4903 stop:5127 length:225 start_codon:yes stop_codon:yes gene_type:complete
MASESGLKLAGGALGLEPLDLREGLAKVSMRNEYDKMRFANLIAPLRVNPMAPEGAGLEHAMLGSVEPPVTFGL